MAEIRLARLGRNLAFLYGAEMAGKILAILCFGRLGRVLGVDRYGDLEFALSVLFVLNLLLDAGLSPFGVREAGRNPGLLNVLCGRITALRLAIAAFCVLPLLVVAWSRGGDGVTFLTAAMVGLVLWPGAFGLAFAFESRNDMLPTAASSLLRQVFLFLATLFVVRAPEQVPWVPALDALGLGLAVLLQQLYFRTRIGRIEYRGAWAGVRELLRASLPLSASAGVWALRLFFPLLALGYLAPAAEVGYLGAAQRLVVAAHTFVWLWFVNLLPSLVRHAEDDVGTRKLLRGSMFLVLAGLAVVLPILHLLAERLVAIIYGADLTAAAAPFRILLVMLAAAFVSGHFRYALIARRRQKEELLAGVAGLLVSVGGVVLLGAGLDASRAAAVTAGAECATLFAAWTFWHRVPRYHG